MSSVNLMSIKTASGDAFEYGPSEFTVTTQVPLDYQLNILPPYPFDT